MKACVLNSLSPIETNPLIYSDYPDPQPAPGQLLIRVKACGICRTDLHVIEGELPPRKTPVIPGHQIVGIVEAGGVPGTRVGVPWLHSTDGTCEYCSAGKRITPSTK